MTMIKALGLDGPLYQQFLIFIGNALNGDLGHLDPHARADGGRVLLAAAEHAGDHSLGDRACRGGGHPARRGGGAQSRQHRGPRGRRPRGAGHRDAEFLARRGADLRVQRRAGLAAVGTDGRTRALRPAGHHAGQLPHRGLHAAGAVQHAGGDGQRVRQAGAHQGLERGRGDLEALPAQRADPRADAVGCVRRQSDHRGDHRWRPCSPGPASAA